MTSSKRLPANWFISDDIWERLEWLLLIRVSTSEGLILGISSLGSATRITPLL
jgi:hypothetical protein